MIREELVGVIPQLGTDPTTITDDIPNSGIKREIRIKDIARSDVPAKRANRMPIIEPGGGGGSIANLRNYEISNLIPNTQDLPPTPTNIAANRGIPEVTVFQPIGVNPFNPKRILICKNSPRVEGH
jgi:hypothetical protein